MPTPAEPYTIEELHGLAEEADAQAIEHGTSFEIANGYRLRAIMAHLGITRYCPEPATIPENALCRCRHTLVNHSHAGVATHCLHTGCSCMGFNRGDDQRGFELPSATGVAAPTPPKPFVFMKTGSSDADPAPGRRYTIEDLPPAVVAAWKAQQERQPPVNVIRLDEDEHCGCGHKPSDHKPLGYNTPARCRWCACDGYHPAGQIEPQPVKITEKTIRLPGVLCRCGHTRSMHLAGEPVKPRCILSGCDCREYTPRVIAHLPNAAPVTLKDALDAERQLGADCDVAGCECLSYETDWNEDDNCRCGHRKTLHYSHWLTPPLSPPFEPDPVRICTCGHIDHEHNAATLNGECLQTDCPCAVFDWNNEG